ncbi:alanyl-tRNA editing protein [bacterium]|nr:alanyl-tRNA editing protein [bacterium]
MPADTRKIFESDPYLKEFEATVLEVNALPQGQGVVLDRTCFYPEGGGQPCDYGTLDGLPVRSVTESDGRIIHSVEGASFKPGDKVRGVLDWDRRFDHMQQHSGQHLLSQAFVRVAKVDTVSFHLGSDESTIDVGIADLAEKTAADVEDEANRIVFENRPLRISVRSAGDLDSIPLRKKPDLTGDVRLIEIADYDWSLCCGTHVRATGEIGLIKILQWEKYKSGTRVHFACGSRALRIFQAKSGLVKSLSRLLTAGESEIETIVLKWRDEKKTSEKRVAALLDEVLTAEAGRLTASAVETGSCKLVSALFKDRDVQEVQNLGRKIVSSPGMVVILGAVGDRATLFFGRSSDVKTDMRELQKAAAEVLTGKGGGSPNWAQCSSERTDLAEEAMAKAIDLLKL